MSSFRLAVFLIFLLSIASLVINPGRSVAYSLPTPSNPIDDTQTFVTQHYLDFLNREPDVSGLQFWSSNIESCGNDEACRDVKRIDTSAAYFLSIEFQQTGYLVHRFYQASFGRRPLFTEFLADTQTIGDVWWLTRPVGSSC